MFVNLLDFIIGKLLNILFFIIFNKNEYHYIINFLFHIIKINKN